MSKTIFTILRSKMFYLDWCIQYAGMIHLSAHVKPVELETVQVIVISH